MEEAKYHSNGIIKRLYITFEAFLKQGEINHVTGDISFINFLFKKKRSILTILDCGFMMNPSAWKREVLRIFWLAIPVKRAQIVTVISQATKDEVLKLVKCNPDKIRVVPVFISEAFTPGATMEFNGNKPVLLQIGTKANKNIERLFEAVKGLPCKLDLVGELTPDHVKMLSDFEIEYENSVRISNEEIMEKYRNCDIVTFVSTYEGFGMPIIEANSFNKPVVTSNLLSMPEVAADAACLVNPYDIKQIREGITRIIKDATYRNELVENGKKNRLRYLPDEISNMYLDIYKEILEK